MVTCRESREAKSSWAPRSMFMGQSTSSRGNGPDSSANERVNPGGVGGHLLGTRINSSGCVASSGSKVVGSLGVSTPIGSSDLCLGNEALSAGAGIMRSFLTMSHHSIISSSLELLSGKIALLPQHTWAGQSSPLAIFFQLCGWHPEGHGLPVGHPFDLDITEVLVLGVEEISEFPPPVGHPFFLLQV